MHGFEDVGEAGLRKLLLQGGLRGSEDFLEGGLNAIPDGTRPCWAFSSAPQKAPSVSTA